MDDFATALQRLISDLQEISHDISRLDAMDTGVPNRNLFNSACGSSPQTLALELATWGATPEAVASILEDMEE